MSEDSQEIEVPENIEPRNVANYFIFISHDLLEKIPPKKKKRADDILRYAESKFIIGELVREFYMKSPGIFALAQMFLRWFMHAPNFNLIKYWYSI